MTKSWYKAFVTQIQRYCLLDGDGCIIATAYDLDGIILAILVFITMIFGYNQGVVVECGDMINSCGGSTGGIIGALIVASVWAFIILPLGIFFYIKLIHKDSGSSYSEEEKK